MRSYLNLIITTAVFANFASAQLRAENTPSSLSVHSSLEKLLERLDALEVLVKEHEYVISVLESSVHGHEEAIATLHQRRLQVNETLVAPDPPNPCELTLVDGYCQVNGDLLVTGSTMLNNGLNVMASGCDNCIQFHDDVIFVDNADFKDPVTFEDPTLFKNDFAIEGEEVKKKKKDDDDDALSVKVSEFVKVKFDMDGKFRVNAESKFFKDVDIEKDASKDDTPNLFVEGDIEAEGTISQNV